MNNELCKCTHNLHLQFSKCVRREKKKEKKTQDNNRLESETIVYSEV